MPSPSQSFITRNRAPRVAIEYDVELYGAQRRLQLPFVIGVLADLSGHPEEPLRPLAERKFGEIDLDAFDASMSVLRPRLALNVPDLRQPLAELAVDLVFGSLSDFEPGAVATRIPALRLLVERRGHLASLLSYADGKTGAEDLLGQVLHDPALLQALASPGEDDAIPTSQTPAWAAGGVLADLLQREFRPRTPEALMALQRALRELARQATETGEPPQADAIATIEQLVAGLDLLLTRQLRLILHHPDFRRLEGAWRGLHYLVSNAETSESLKIRVLNVTKAELSKSLRRYKGTSWDQSPLFKRIYENEYGSFGGEPFGCLVGDFRFDHSVGDIEMLGELARICAAAHAPFIADAALTFANVDLGAAGGGFGRTVVGQLVTPEFAAWRSLQHAEESRYVALAMPRFLGRLPWSRATRPLPDFDFEEIGTPGNPDEHVWCSAAYAMAVCIARAQAQYGWCARICGIESGGAVEGLPVHVETTAAGESRVVGPVETAINDRAESELHRAGFMTLIHRRGADFAAFSSAPSIHLHARFDDPAAESAARLASSLPYLLASCRFAQYLKCVARDQVGSFQGPDAMERALQDWLADYIDADPAQSSEAVRARRPLASAEIQVSEVEGNPGYYAARLYILPMYQLGGLSTSLRIVTRLSSGRAAG